MLPDDGHVHSQWSWDAPKGDMEATCARAVRLGMRSLAFTEHVDLTPWTVYDGVIPTGFRGAVTDGVVLPAPLDVTGYFECIDRCRQRFGELEIVSGLEFSEPHLHPDAMADLLTQGDFDRVMGSVHALGDLRCADENVTGHGLPSYVEISGAYEQRTPLEVVRSYLAEVLDMIKADPPFAVLAHIDYPLRRWPGSEPFDLHMIEEQMREVLTVLAPTERALEVNTRLPLAEEVVEWWHQAGGRAVTFGSDAHEPDRLAWEFAEAAEMVSAHGFRPGSVPTGMWSRT